MRASAIEFRLRLLIHLLLYLIGFFAPWNYLHHIDTKPSTWAWLDSFLYAHGLGFQTAVIASLALAIALALIAALLRTWASAYLGAAIVKDAVMHGDRVAAAGPYRRFRNPLYVAIFLHTFALALLMPPSGAIFAIVTIAIFELRLILGEERFLTAQLGQPYLDYKARVPRLFPSLTPRTASSGVKPAWPLAFISEIYFWGVVVTFAALGWQYNTMLLTRGVLISLGLSFIVRAALPRPKTEA